MMSNNEGGRGDMNTSDNKAGFSTLVGIVAVVVSVGAGIYLLSTQSAAEEATVFDALMHGMGAYFIARGAWMLHGLTTKKGETA